MQAQPRLTAVFSGAAIVAIGLTFLVINLELPIVRNSFVYAASALRIIEHGFNPLPVISDAGLSQGKPIVFALFTAPFVAVLGVNAGPKAASFFATVFFLVVAYFVVRRLNRRAGIADAWIPLELALIAGNPLFFYQFWSGYPDALFAGLVLLAFVIADLIVTETDRDTRWLIPLLGVVIYAAVLTKFYGAVLGIAVPAYMLLHVRRAARTIPRFAEKLRLTVAVFVALGTALVLARLGMNVTLDFAPQKALGGGYAGYVQGLLRPRPSALLASVIVFIATVVLSFHFTLPFLARKSAVRAWRHAPTVFPLIYLLGLLPFSGSGYNMRFYLPIFPFIAVAVAAAVRDSSRPLRRGLLSAYAGAAVLLILNYNLVAAHERLDTVNAAASWTEEKLKLKWLDNLRMNQHLQLRANIDLINDSLPPRAALYWSSAYYGTATHGVAGGLGIRPDIRVRYLLAPRVLPRTDSTVFLTIYWLPGSAAELEDRFYVESLGGRTVKLTPLQVALETTADRFPPGQQIRFSATASASVGSPVSSVELRLNGDAFAVDSEPPFTFIWNPATRGRHVARAFVLDSAGRRKGSVPVTLFVGVNAFVRRIERWSDDAEEWPNRSVSLASSDLDLVEDFGRSQLVALRFNNMAVRRGADIRTAYVQFTTKQASGDPAELVIRGEFAGDAARFAALDGDLSSRRRTTASVVWRPAPWLVVGESVAKQRTPDLTPIIREITDQPEWQPGSALVLLVTGQGTRSAHAREGGWERAPLLHVELH